jgi:hypothetical protein
MLAELQHRLQAAICEGADPGALLRGNELGLQAYRFAYRARLVEALQDNHPALHQALGDAAFTALTHAYLAEHPSSEPSIRWFGAQLADFMARWPELPHPALVDLARLDWALRHAFDAPAHAPLQAEQLADPALWAATALRLQPHVRISALHWQVAPAWHALQQARDAGIEAELPAPEPLDHALLSWRIGLAPQWRSLDAAEADLLRGLQGQSAADWLGAQGEAALTQAVAHLQRWVVDGLLVAP